MKAKRRQRNKNSAFIRIAIVAAVAFGFFKLVQIQMQLNEKQALIDAQNEQIAVETIYNEDLQNKVDNSEENEDRTARDNGYVRPNDQVFRFTN